MRPILSYTWLPFVWPGSQPHHGNCLYHHHCQLHPRHCQLHPHPRHYRHHPFHRQHHHHLPTVTLSHPFTQLPNHIEALYDCFISYLVCLPFGFYLFAFFHLFSFFHVYPLLIGYSFCLARSLHFSFLFHVRAWMCLFMRVCGDFQSIIPSFTLFFSLQFLSISSILLVCWCPVFHSECPCHGGTCYHTQLSDNAISPPTLPSSLVIININIIFIFIFTIPILHPSVYLLIIIVVFPLSSHLKKVLSCCRSSSIGCCCPYLFI